MSCASFVLCFMFSGQRAHLELLGSWLRLGLSLFLGVGVGKLFYSEQRDVRRGSFVFGAFPLQFRGFCFNFQFASRALGFWGLGILVFRLRHIAVAKAS